MAGRPSLRIGQHGKIAPMINDIRSGEADCAPWQPEASALRLQAAELAREIETLEANDGG